MEEHIEFPSGDLMIEGLFDDCSGHRGVVITHPHPQYGGDMYNYVVGTIAEGFRTKGVGTLRFNFRGVGGSQGSYGNGIGEQEDVAGAFAFLAEKGKSQIDLAGYSFGAWVSTQSALDPAIQEQLSRLVLVSPPAGMMSGLSSAAIPQLHLIVTGSRDDIAPANGIEPYVGKWNPEARLEIIDGADHFYAGYIDRLGSVIVDNIA